MTGAGSGGYRVDPAQVRNIKLRRKLPLISFAFLLSYEQDEIRESEV